ncbi:hypothetical protein B0A52_01855 [Exophiala mesophila]|uniref:Uncharacterized protein n=1 Tax=Exophiala mesophila TaxID=212818 RepID=A0A438NE74_EXOME|nr:hypothetical protein B0A52_01855 [Exophiala mesophila]
MMASSDCKNFHQSRRPSYDRTLRAREQLLFGNAKATGPAAQVHLQRSMAADDEWRRSTVGSSTSSPSSPSTPEQSPTLMHNYGDSWFENLNTLANEYHRQKSEKPQSHSYGDDWFENLNHQREELEHKKADESQRQAEQSHFYGQTWFKNYEQQWTEWNQLHTDPSTLRQMDMAADSDDESCELGF